MSNFKRAQQLAEEVLKENYITVPPVPVGELAKNYGYDVIEGEMPSNIAGLVDINKHVIYINQADSATRKAFTIAHELGHIKLHSELLKKNPDITILYRRPLGKKDDKVEEQEANCFAASLLVPEEMLKNVLNEYPNLNLTAENNRSILASLFGVSNEVMGYRLHDINVKSHGR